MYFDFSSYFYYVVNSFGHNKILRDLCYDPLLLTYQKYYLLFIVIYYKFILNYYV